MGYLQAFYLVRLIYFGLIVFISDNVLSGSMFISEISDTEFVYSQK